jgi:hypothetical protein
MWFFGFFCFWVGCYFWGWFGVAWSVLVLLFFSGGYEGFLLG